MTYLSRNTRTANSTNWTARRNSLAKSNYLLTNSTYELFSPQLSVRCHNRTCFHRKNQILYIYILYKFNQHTERVPFLVVIEYIYLRWTTSEPADAKGFSEEKPRICLTEIRKELLALSIVLRFDDARQCIRAHRN